MKKIILAILSAAILLTFTACGTDPLYSGSATNSTATEETEADVSKDSYANDFGGMQKYLLANNLIKGDPTNTAASIVGAQKGVRYTLSSSAYIEFYEYNTAATPDEATKKAAEDIKAQIEKNGTFTVYDMDPLTGVYSDSGKYLAVYNATIDYDFLPIIDAFKSY